MSTMVTELDLALLKLQTTYGTPEAALLGTDVLETVGAATIKPTNEMEDIELVSGGGFGQDLSVPGGTMYDITSKVLIRSEDATKPGQFGTAMQAAGFQSAEVSDVYTYTPLSDRAVYKDATLWGYSGELGTNKSIVYKSGNIIFAPKFTFEASKPVYLELSGKGTFVGVPAAGTQPSITKEGVLPPSLLGATVLINGYAYCLLSGEIDMAQEITLNTCTSETYGFGQSVIVKRKTTWNMKIYRLLPAVNDPITNMVTGATAALSIAWGTHPQGFTIAAPAAQIKDISPDEQDGVETYTLSGIIKDNAVTITQDTTA